MGMSLCVVRLTGKAYSTSVFGEEYPVYVTKSVDWFDSNGYVGDRWFVLNNSFDYLDEERELESRELARPECFHSCKKWVIENLPHSRNQERLLAALSRMELDENLCFVWSF